MEHERADRPGRLQLFVLGKLGLQHLFDLGRERERPSLAVLRRVRVQPDTAPGPIDVAPFERQHFARRPPARGEGEPDDVRERARTLRAVSVLPAPHRCRRSGPVREIRAACCAPCSIGTCGHCTSRPACTARLNARRSAASSRLISARLRRAVLPAASAMKARISARRDRRHAAALAEERQQVHRRSCPALRGSDRRPFVL